jgi:hypothetical protein
MKLSGSVAVWCAGAGMRAASLHHVGVFTFLSQWGQGQAGLAPMFGPVASQGRGGGSVRADGTTLAGVLPQGGCADCMRPPLPNVMNVGHCCHQ